MFKRSTYLLRDIKNTIKYGLNGPKALELIYINPMVLTSIQSERYYKAKDAGKVIRGDWGVTKEPLKEKRKYQIIYNKVVNNISWSDSGIYEYYQNIESYPLNENIQRHEKLSLFIEYLSSGGKFLNRRELNSKNFREDGGVIVHLDPEGELVFSGNGYHRLAIAHALCVDCMPVALGAVHEQAIMSGALLKIKNKSNALMAEMGQRYI